MSRASEKKNVLVIVCGLPGTGKTTVATALARERGAVLLRTDVIRKELYAFPRYTEHEGRRVYEELFRQASACLAAGHNVVLDATFSRKSDRAAAAALASRTGCDFRLAETIAAEEVVRLRLEGRKGDESDARFPQYLEQKKLFEPIAEPHIVVDTAKNFEADIAQVW